MRLIHLAEIDSTQSFLARHPELGLCGVLADAQTAGRGRSGNGWDSAPGAGLWLSARVPVPDLPPGLVPQKAMLAVIAALEPCGVPLGLKWPNDLVAWKDGGLVKLGGIIGEMGRGTMTLGVGVNLKAAPAIPGRVIPPASLIELGAACLPSRQCLAEEILARWRVLDRGQDPAFYWPQEGDSVQWEEGHGICQGWLEDGRLSIAQPEGAVYLSAGDVRGLSR